MKEFKDTEELIKWLKKQDLNKYGVGLGLNGKKDCGGWEGYPYKISGYLYDKETMEFGIKPFKSNQPYHKDETNVITEIRKAIEEV